MAEWAVLVVFVLFSSTAFIAGAGDSIIHGWTFIGAAGQNPFDDLQYLQWATDAAHHGLIANLYGTAIGAHVFFHPLWLVAGLLHVWVRVPYAVLMGILQVCTAMLLVLTTMRYVRHVLGRPSLFAVVLALFATTPLYLFVRALDPASVTNGTANHAIREMMPLLQMDGYFPIALTVTGMMWFLMLLEPLLDADGPQQPLRLLGSGRGWLVGVLGAVVSLFHPWQGIALLVILVLMALLGRNTRAAVAMALPLVLTLLPLVYYKVLPHLDASWQVSSTAQHEPLFPLSGSLSWVAMTAALGVAYALLGIPAWLQRGVSTSGLLVRLWPVGIAVAFFASPTARMHALDGLSIPLALLIAESRSRVLALRGSRPNLVLRSAWSATVLLTLAGGPIAYVQMMHYSLNPLSSGAALPAYDGHALTALAKLPHGYVLTTPALGDWVPVVTEDPTWVGHPIWTPDFDRRQRVADRLFGTRGSLTSSAARSYVAATSARYVMIPCGSSTRLTHVLAADGWRVTPFGCATLLARPRA